LVLQLQGLQWVLELVLELQGLQWALGHRQQEPEEQQQQQSVLARLELAPLLPRPVPPRGQK